MFLLTWSNMASICLFHLFMVAIWQVVVEVWSDLLHISIDCPWLIIGDFNAVKGSHEKSRGNVNSQAC